MPDFADRHPFAIAPGQPHRMNWLSARRSCGNIAAKAIACAGLCSSAAMLLASLLLQTRMRDDLCPFLDLIAKKPGGIIRRSAKCRKLRRTIFILSSPDRHLPIHTPLFGRGFKFHAASLQSCVVIRAVTATCAFPATGAPRAFPPFA